MPRLLSVATAVPRHKISQKDILERCKILFGPLLADRRRQAIFERAGVSHRHLAEPPEYYGETLDFERKNRDYARHALMLATQALETSLKNACLGFPDIDHIVSVTTTGLLTPSLESHLAQALAFPRSVRRTPIFGAGCAGGVVALSRTAEHLKGHPDETAVALSTELCSMTYLPKDKTMTQLVAAALFGDGAAAAVMTGDSGQHETKAIGEIICSASHLLPDSLDLMGWDFTSEGMRLVLSPKVPKAIEKHLPEAAEEFFKKAGIGRKDVSHWILHPGSSRVLDAMAKALNLAENDLRHSRRFLSRFGNLSSASVFFVLAELLENGRPKAGEHAVIAAMGPGFAAEMLLLRFL